MTVTWTPVAGAVGHRVYRGTTLLATVDALVTSYTDVIGPGTYVYGVEAFDASGPSARCTDSGTRLPLPAPSPCGASDTDPTGVLVTWTAVEGATGYRILRAGSVIHTAAPDETSFRDVPLVGTYTYCVRAQDRFGLYAECCDSGTRPALPTVGWCRASDADPSGILFEWEDVVGETGYRVYRDDALLQTLGPDQSSYRDVPGPGTYAYCVEPILAAGSSPRCCDGGRQPSLPAPAACSASQDSREGVTLTWAAVAGAEGYRVLRDGAPVVTLGPEAASYLDTPSAGTYSYCVEAFDARGTSPMCCQLGTRLGLPAPGPCAAGDTDEDGVDVSWTPVAGAEGYRVFRDGVLAQTTGAGETTHRDTPAPGTYSYCVEAFASWSVSPRCCDAGTRAGTAIPFACAASDTGTVGVFVTWDDVPGEDGYRVLRDGALVATVGPGVTSHYDRPPVGVFTYCVEAFDAGGALALCCDPGTRRGEPVPSSASVRVSWNSCSPQVSDTYFSGPGTYKLVISATGVAQPMIGHDSSLLFGFGLADAWRFDDAGCQTGSQWSASPTAFSKSCPALLGNAPLPIVFFGYAPDTQCGELRLAVAFDEITPVAATRYTLWQVTFDHTYSVVGPSTPGEACGGAERGISIDPQFALIACSSGQLLALQPTPGDDRVTWQGGAAVRTVPVTWGKLKGLYR